jgi:hypothetical protein
MAMIRCIHGRITAQVAFALGRLFGEDMPQVGLSSLETATTERFETLGRAALGFELRHNNSFYLSLTPGVLSQGALVAWESLLKWRPIGNCPDRRCFHRQLLVN